MNVYGMCFEGSTDQCLAPFATSYEFNGLSLTINDLSGAGVTNPHYAINDNSTQASEISMGTLNIAGGAKQWIFFNTVSAADDVVEIGLGTEEGGLNLSLLGDLKIQAYLGNTLVETLDWGSGIINGLNVVDLLNNGDVIKVPFRYREFSQCFGIPSGSSVFGGAMHNIGKSRIQHMEILCG
jgi:hypothetical protein